MKGYENTFDDFHFLFDLVKDSFVIRYREYNENDKIKLKMEYCIPFITELEEVEHLRIFEMQTGKTKEFISTAPFDFDYGSYRFYQKDFAKIFLHFNSGKTFSFYIKKKNISTLTNF